MVARSVFQWLMLRCSEVSKTPNFCSKLRNLRILVLDEVDQLAKAGLVFWGGFGCLFFFRFFE